MINACHIILLKCSWQVEKFHKLWNFGNCQFAIMELQEDGFYKLITKLRNND